jgi:hypothetical protein
MEKFKPESSPAKNDISEEKEKKYRTSKIHIAYWCKGCKTNAEALDRIKIELRHDIPEKELAEKAISELEKCKDIEDRKEFREAIFEVLKPIVDLRIEKPELFEQEENQKKEVLVRVNELLSYGISGDNIHIHAIPNDKVENALSKFSEGLQELAGVVEKHPEIKVIRATSWIVAQYPKIIERFGFTLDGEINEEIREKHFENEQRKIWMAHMTREDFLHRYFKM